MKIRKTPYFAISLLSGLGATAIVAALMIGSTLVARAQVVPATSMSLPTSVTAEGTPTACYTFYNNIGLDQPISTTDATALQQVLVAQGLWNPSVEITGYDRAVQIAVAAFQEENAAQILTPNGLTAPTGYFGPSTRSVLNAIYGCGGVSGVTANTVPNTVTANSGVNANGMTEVTVGGQEYACPSGWICTPPAGEAVLSTCPAGWTCEPTAWVSSSTLAAASTTTATNYVGVSTSVSTSTVTGTLSTQPNLSVNPNSFFLLASQPTITEENMTAGGAATATTEYIATFNVTVNAVTGNLTLGLPGSTSPAFGDNPNLVAIYKNGVEDSLSNYQPVNVTYEIPNGAILSPDGESFSISQGQSVTIPVTYTFLVNGTSANTYAVQIQGIQSSLGLINSMMNQTAWRTPSV